MCFMVFLSKNCDTIGTPLSGAKVGTLATYPN